MWRATGGTALRLSGGQARERRIRELAPRQRMLHFATHGFFLDSTCATLCGRRSAGRAEADSPRRGRAPAAPAGAAPPADDIGSPAGQPARPQRPRLFQRQQPRVDDARRGRRRAHRRGSRGARPAGCRMGRAVCLRHRAWTDPRAAKACSACAAPSRSRVPWTVIDEPVVGRGPDHAPVDARALSQPAAGPARHHRQHARRQPRDAPGAARRGCDNAPGPLARGFVATGDWR